MQLSKRFSFQVRAVIIGLIAVFAIGCNTSVARDDSTSNYFPNLADYTSVNTLDLQQTISNAAAGAAAGAGQLQVTAIIAAINGYTTCLQNAGALEGRIYYLNGNPLKAGAMLIINRNKITDPATLLGCTNPAAQGFAPPNAEYTPCARACTIRENNNEYYVFYAATSTQVCDAFATAMPNCQ
ncbi:MAG: hypothetical protein OHK0023_22260 [Anaerolineae bacterium]